jgi:polar amino acid transport system substrate-binding protein
VAVVSAKDQNYPGIAVVGKAPYDIDYVSLFTNREEYGMINYLDLFVNQQVRTGRYKELFDKWIGGELPNLMVPNTYR